MEARHRVIRAVAVFGGLACGLGLAGAPLNVLLITIDDLRPELGCYGNQQVKTPHIDKIAARGVVFRHAYAQQAICNASRASFLTGLRPDSTGVYDLTTHFRARVPDVITLPEYFKQRGYLSRAFGKVLHPAFPGHGIGNDLGDDRSWSTPPFMPGPRYYYSPRGIELAREAYARAVTRGSEPGAPNWVAEAVASLKPGQAPSEDDWTKVNVRVLATEAPDVPDNVLYDGQVAERAIEALNEIAQTDRENGQPFFLAVGFLKPHLPFVAPRKYWDLYDPAKLSIARNISPPADAPQIAMDVPMDELRDTYPVDIRVPAPGEKEPLRPSAYPLRRDTPLSHDQRLQLTRGYYACISFVDAQIGRITAELEHLGLAENTVIVVMGDHGFHLGQHGLWGKLTNFEDATRTAFICAAPGKEGRGASNALVELVDVYPTLCELAGFPALRGLEGKSVVPLLETPESPWKTAAFSQYPRGEAMGYSMRTERYRFTEWRNLSDEKVIARELYDHAADPGENMNVANRADNAALMTRLSQKLRDGWREAASATAGSKEAGGSHER